MKKAIILLTAFFLVQVMFFSGMVFTSSPQRVRADSSLSWRSIDLAGEMRGKSLEAQENDLTSTLRETTSQIESRDITDIFKQSLGEGRVTSSSGGPTWAKAFGGISSDFCYSVLKTSDEGYIVAGYTSSFGAGGNDVLLLKLDLLGNISWARTFGGAKNDCATSLLKTADGGYIVAGYTNSFGAGSNDILVLKLDAQGNLVWGKTFGGSSNEEAYSISEGSNGEDQGYIVAGYSYSYSTNYDFLVLKMDSNGNLNWAKTFGAGSIDMAKSVLKTTDGSYIVVGYSYSSSTGYDFLVLKLDIDGNLSWAKTFGGSSHEYAYSVYKTSDGGFVVAGNTSSFGVGNFDFLILRVDSAGNLSWAKAFGGSNYECASSVWETSDGGYIVAGYTTSFGATGYDFLVLRLDSNGTLSWAKVFGGVGDDQAFSVSQATDGGYVIAGATGSFGAGSNDFLVLKLDSNGDISGCSCGFLRSCTPSVALPAVTNAAKNLSFNIVSSALSSCIPSVSAPTVSSYLVCEGTYSLTVNVNPAGSGTVTKVPDQETYAAGTPVTLTATPSPGYHFLNWSGDVPSGHEQDNPLTITMDSDKTINANFTINTYTVTFDKNGGDTEANPRTKTATHGGHIDSLPTPPSRIGYTFREWNTEANGSGARFDSNTPVYGDITVYAQWIIQVFSLTVNVVGNGTVTPSGGTSYEYGSVVTLTATPSPGYRFLNWSGDVPSGHEKENPLTLNMDSNKTLIATFELLEDPKAMPSMSWWGAFLLTFSLLLLACFAL
ncbi:MAG: InlB B-repeat-containing protein [Caldiserica bacterium]|nr:InlB B-repeat-containing protein [Caldisericota bacterium]